jgi:DNA-formamidopyrimidine glycosylase
MPEGPEVKRMSDILNEKLKDLYLLSFNIFEGSKYNKYPLENIEIFRDYLPLKLKRVFSIAKKIIFEFDDDVFIINEPRMEGHWAWEKVSKHSNIMLAFGYNKNNMWYLQEEAFYDDTRHFGIFKICNGNEIQFLKEKLGPDILNDEITDDEFKNCFKNVQKWEICKALMEQNIVSGIGNYLKSEILYRARILPNRKVETLTDNDFRILKRVAVKTIKLSYESNGFTFDSYIDPDNNIGKFEVLVYGKKVDIFGYNIIKSKFSDGRSTYWVKERQS